MNCEPLLTYHAPPERASQLALRAQAHLVRDRDLLTGLLDAMTEAVLILNPHRQIVMANRVVREMLDMQNSDVLIGMRPGEALGCLRACVGPSGCGTSEFCSTCGGVNAILTGIAGRGDMQECNVPRGNGEPLDLLVRTTPLMLDGQRFVIVALADISHEKRRRALEQTFFHDLLNTASGLRMLGELLEQVKPAEQGELRRALRQGVEQMIDEVRAQRDLLAAENRELAVQPMPLHARGLLRDVLESYERHPAAEGLRLELDPHAQDVQFTSDPVLLVRVLGNMVKNALEACQPGQSVTVGCSEADNGVRFWVRNPGCMPRPVQLQLFNRSFSTKGNGRGLGTYSMKLLTECYLGGKVDFSSTPQAGTTFCAWYPRDLRADA